RGLLKLTKRQRSCEREAWIGEVHGIESIECFCAEANPMPFLRKPERLLQREIGIEIRRQSHDGLHTAMTRQLVCECVSRSRISEDARISFLIERDPCLDRLSFDGQ